MKLKFLLGAFAAFFFSMVLGAVTIIMFNRPLPKDRAERMKKKQQELMENAKQYYFTGWKDKRKKALAVIIDNAVERDPRRGSEKAGVVVEFPVEGLTVLRLFPRIVD